MLSQCYFKGYLWKLVGMFSVIRKRCFSVPTMLYYVSLGNLLWRRLALEYVWVWWAYLEIIPDACHLTLDYKCFRSQMSSIQKDERWIFKMCEFLCTDKRFLSLLFIKLMLTCKTFYLLLGESRQLTDAAFAAMIETKGCCRFS